MSRYIDADDLRHMVLYFADARNLNGNHEQAKAYNHCLIMIDESKTADVVEVVRCKDCKWQDKGENECESWNLCRHNVIEYFAIYDEHFCEWGERRTNEI